MSGGTYYLIFENNLNLNLNDPITFNINENVVTINWIKDYDFNCYYHKEHIYSKETIRQHTIRFIRNLEEIYKCKIKYRLTKKVTLEVVDLDAFGVLY